MRLDSILADLRYGIRALIRKPIITVVAIISIAVGTGGSTAIFTAIDAILLRPLPFGNPDRLTSVWTYNTKQDQVKRYASYPDFADWREASLTYEEMAAWYNQPASLTDVGEPIHVNTSIVSHSLFSVMGVQPAMGRAFEAEEAKDQNSVVLSHRAWQQWFGADRGVLGRNISLNGTPYSVIGVMPASFQFPIQSDSADMWIKMTVAKGGMLTFRGARFLSVIGRLKPDVTLAQARAELASISSSLQEKYPKSNANIGTKLNALDEELVRNIRPSLLILFASVGLVLLIACVTVANLLLAEGLARGREIAVRTALGAGRRRIIRQLLTEYMLIAIAGGILGALLGFWGCQALVAMSPVELPSIHEIHLDGRVLAFTLGITALTGLLFGMTPALQLSASKPSDALRERTSGAGNGARGRVTQKVLVVSQIAVTQVLLVGAGLLIHSFWRLQQADTGINPENVLTLRIGLPPSYGEKDCVDFFQRLQQDLKTLPGVESASSVVFLPFSNQEVMNADFEIEGRPSTDNVRPSANLQLIQPEYFRTMGIPLKDGRDFSDHDIDGAPGVAIINETVARKYFDGLNPIGRQIRQGPVARTVVGVVGDVHHLGAQYDMFPEIYMPLAQSPMDVMYVVVKTAVDPVGSIQAVRGVVRGINNNLPIYDVQPLKQRVAATAGRQQFSMNLLMAFAGVALFLTVIGLYGVLTNSVAQRKKEIGIRMALGATPSAIRRGFVSQGMILTMIGLVTGIAFALLLTRFMEGLLFGVTATDPLTFVMLAALLLLVALMACYVPARRASQTDPMAVLRSD